MENHSSEQAEWRAVIVSLIIVGLALGVEQVLPMSDGFRSQIGVLTVLLGFGCWHMIVGLVTSGKN